MTVDDLVKVYCDAFYAQRDKAPEKGITEADRAGVTAIVRALRDETRHMTLNRDSLEELFTQILGDAGEKVTIKETAVGAVLRLETGDPPLPATDAAPAVCVWVKGFLPYYEWVTDCGRLAAKTGDFCQDCGRPITFTEANHG